MVDVGNKQVTKRVAIAACEVEMKTETFRLLKSGTVKKGDAFTVAKTAGILAAKKTGEWIPLCHSLPLEYVDIRFFDRPFENGFLIESEVRSGAKTGVEMEALTAVAAVALTLYDMVKSYDPDIVIANLHLLKKSGGKSEYSIQSGNHNGQ